jgi:hypothetical protein
VGTAAWRLGVDPAANARSVSGTPISQLPPVTSATPVSSTSPSAGGAAVPATSGPAATIDVLCRDAWGAQPITGGLTSQVPARMTVHHTAALVTDHAAAPSLVRDHQRFHQQDRGWADIAYHFVVDDAGVIYEGRPVETVGDTATGYDPTGHVLVACEGNFDRQVVPDAQYAALIEVLAWAAATYDIAPATITGHRDWASTACPGDDLYARISDGSLARAVAAALAAGPPMMNLRCGPDALAFVSAIDQDVDVGPVGRPPQIRVAE